MPVTMSSKRTATTAGRNVPTATPDPAWEATWKHDKHGVAPLSNTLARDSAFGTGSASIVQWRRGNQSKYGVVSLIYNPSFYLLYIHEGESLLFLFLCVICFSNIVHPTGIGA